MTTKVIAEIWFFATALVILSGQTMAGEHPEGRLFTKVDLKSTTLTPKQERILDHVVHRPSTIGVEVVKRVGKKPENVDRSLIIPLPEGESADLVHYKIVPHKDSTQLTWNIASNGNSGTLTFVGDSVSGIIYAGGSAYLVEPLGDGLQVISRVDQARFPLDEPSNGK